MKNKRDKGSAAVKIAMTILFVLTGLMLPTAKLLGQRRTVTATATVTLTVMPSPAVSFSPTNANVNSRLAGVSNTSEAGVTLTGSNNVLIQLNSSRGAGNSQINLRATQVTTLTAKQLNGVSSVEIICIGS